MNHRARLDRLERNMRRVRPSASAVQSAMDQFRSTGALPDDLHLAQLVIEWAQSGVNLSECDEAEATATSFRLAAAAVTAPRDVVIRGLYEDAVDGPEPARSLARIMLCQLAGAGFDPSAPLWLKHGWPVPTMTCNSVALSIAGFPTRLVSKEHRRRASVLAHGLRRYAKTLGTDETRTMAFLDAVDSFRECGELPADRAMADAVLADAELTAYLQSYLAGVDCEPLADALARCREASDAERPQLLSDVHAAMAEQRRAPDLARAEGGRQVIRSFGRFLNAAVKAEAASA